MAGRSALGRLSSAGFSEEELKVSRRKLGEIVSAVDPKASLSPEVEDVLLELATKFVENAATFGGKFAQHRNSRHVQLADLRLYVETTLGVHVPGFGSAAAGKLPVAGYVDTLHSGVPGRVPAEHMKRLRAKNSAHVVLQDDHELALPASKRARTS